MSGHIALEDILRRLRRNCEYMILVHFLRWRVLIFALDLAGECPSCGAFCGFAAYRPGVLTVIGNMRHFVLGVLRGGYAVDFLRLLRRVSLLM